MGDVQLTRRSAVIAGVALAAGLAVGVVSRSAAAEADLLRPPGALPEADFMARCIKCQRCVSVCPENIIAIATLEDGIPQAKTPVIDFSTNYCTFCELCREVCPTVAIGYVDPLQPAQGRLGVAVIHTDRCLAFHEAGSCGICIDACQYGALSFDDGRRPVVDDALCNGCGQCVSICPANVLTSFEGGSYRGVEVVTEQSFAKDGEA